MTKHTYNQKKERHLQRMFLITKGFLLCTPIICYFYITMTGWMQQTSFQEVLSQHPSMSVLFLISMLNPYIAYLLHLMQKKLQEGKESFVCINMVLLLIAQLLTMNVFYFVMLLYVFYKACDYYQIHIGDSLKKLTFTTSFVQGGGSMLIVMLSSICLFATIQLM